MKTTERSVMRIHSDSDDFLPEHFDILRFYDEILLFAWHVVKLKVFRYDDPDGARNFRLLVAPGEVRNVQNFGERIFVTCSPYGVYKLSKNYQFVLLSSTAIGIGARYYQVLRIEDKYISLGDKQAKTSKLLLKHDPVDGATLHIVGLIKENVDNELMTVLLDGAVDGDLCIFSRGCEIYKITPDAIKILYSCFCLITDIVGVRKNGKLTCLLYFTNKSTIILMYAKNSELIFEKTDINHMVKTAYAFIDEVLEDTIWIVHSDGVRTYKTRKILGEHSVESTELSEKHITCLRNYNFEIFGLNSMGDLVRVNLRMKENLADTGENDFIQLKREMLEGTDCIVEEICRKVKELQSFDNELFDRQNALKRINMAACKQTIPRTPKLKVHKIANKTFVNCEFGYDVPKQCQLSFSVKSGGRKIFATKQVTENETNVELPVPNAILSETASITADLITLADEGYSWCIIKNCINDTGSNKVQVQMSHDERVNFVKARLAALQNLKMDDGLDIVKLNEIKTSIRKEFNVI